MFETLDIMISIGVVFLILSMVLKYLLTIVKRFLRTKAKVVAREMSTFIGENTSKYLIPYLEQKAKYLNFLDDTERKWKKSETKGLRQLNKEQLIGIVDSLKEFLKGKKNSDVQKDLKLTEFFSSEEIKKLKPVKDIEDHLINLKDRIETNYDNTMQKISTIYETKLRKYTFIWGIILALFINADIFEIYKTFSSNALIRDKLSAQAEVINSQMKLINEQQITGKETESIKELVKEAKITMSSFNKNLTEAGLHLGWSWEFFSHLGEIDGFLKTVLYCFKKVLGIIISGLLISFGAPFWHEFLGSFTGIRNMLRGGGKNPTSP